MPSFLLKCAESVGQRTLTAFLLSIFILSPARAQAPAADLTKVSLEELADIDVTSVSKKEQKLSQTGAAAFVLSQNDIRRSGASNIPDLLRMVPGVDVAQINANSWAISIRGFNDRYADKVLVMVDGRSVYNHTAAGVYWDEVDVPLEDIDRIEVIRGPGGTVWGANAVNGVISIITKSAEATHGGLVTAAAGNRTSAEALAQYGGAAGANGSYRIFEKYFNVDNSRSEPGRTADGWHAFHAGFRSDWHPRLNDSLTVQGDLLQTEEGQNLTNVVSRHALPLVETFNDRIRTAGGNILSRWNHTLSNGSDISLQVYDDYYVRTAQGLRESANTLDLDFHHHIRLGPRHDIVWGLGYRDISDHYGTGFNVTFSPSHRNDSLYSAFVQDQIKLTRSLSLTLGAKQEHNAYTGFEYEPGAQLVWDISPRNTLWTSFSRAIRQPARRDYGIDVDFAVIPLPDNNYGVLELTGNPKTQSEDLDDFEAGYRTQLSNRVSLDVVAFVSLYRELATATSGAPFLNTQHGTPYLEFPLIWGYGGRANNYGAEFFAHWKVSGRWQLSPGFSWLNNHVLDPSPNAQTVLDPTNTPAHTLGIHSSVNLFRSVEWDSSLFGVGRINGVPGYVRVDARLGWHVGEFVDVSVVGQNLFTPRHLEFPTQYFIASTPVQRSVSVRLSVRF